MSRSKRLEKREGTFKPQIARETPTIKRIDEILLSLYSKGLTTGEISSLFTEILPCKRGYSQSLRSRRRPSLRITDEAFEVREEMWSARSLDDAYAVIFVDAFVVKVRRRSGREPADLCRDRRRRPWRARIVGWNRW